MRHRLGISNHEWWSDIARCCMFPLDLVKNDGDPSWQIILINTQVQPGDICKQMVSRFNGFMGRDSVSDKPLKRLLALLSFCTGLKPRC